MTIKLTRRSFVLSSTASSLVTVSGLAMPAISRAQSRPVVTHGVQSGDVDVNSGMIWARTDKPARMHVEVATTESFANARRLASVHALPEGDFAAKLLLDNLPSDQEVFYRVSFADLDDVNAVSEPVVGRFRTAPASRRSVKLVWSGDTAGQGWGIDESRGGMTTYATMLRHNPDFFLHSGDTVYCDGPITAEKEMPNGEIWKSIVAEGVEKVAETLDEFRGRYKYNMLDTHVRALNAAVPAIYQWDDHEVVNNWSSSKDLTGDDRYTVKSLPLLTARATRAFHEMLPVRYVPAEPGRIYRKISYGPLLDVFVVDLRSYRGPNDANVEPELTPENRILGSEQIRWLQGELLQSRATWKVIASDMPIGLIVWNDGAAKTGSEAIANAENGPAKGRELEFADLLRFIKSAAIRNTVWLTADVHYTAAHYYNPEKAAFQDFEPFWEFVSGPLHSGSFGPGELDMTFGPELKFAKAPGPELEQNQPPSEGLQFFGVVDIDGASEAMTVRLMDRDDKELFRQTLEPQRMG